MNQNNENESFRELLRDRGYAAALLLCAVAIAVGGFIYYRTTSASRQETPQEAAAVIHPSRPANAVTQLPDDLVPAIGTAPAAPEQTRPTQPAQPAPTQVSRVVRPVSGETVAAYAMDELAYNETTRDWRVHNGIDLAADAGAEVAAAADGTVYTVYTDEVMGTTVVLRHEGGFVTTYASLDPEVSVEVGETVTCGQTIGYVGSSALTETALSPHVHFAAAMNGIPMDPEEFLAR